MNREDELVEQLIKGEINKEKFDNLMKVKHLHVGARVMARGGHDAKVKKGTIRIFEDENYIGVEFDNEINGGHDINGKCSYGHGWFIGSDSIVKVLHEEGEERGI